MVLLICGRYGYFLAFVVIFFFSSAGDSSMRT
jgi:hypothetical protein